ncbi:MAG: hypothetical protein FWD13_02960 [Treponema sp.]|nr:hypothetical protein [Treponema sp.]
MDIKIIFKKSAFKHGESKEDIRWAFNTAKYDNLIEGFNNKYLLIGFNTKGNLIEVIYNDLGEDTASVFHAMGCRNELLPLLTRGRM